MLLIEETLQNYDVSGLELVLNYVPYYFHPNEVAEGSQIMTAFIARVANLVHETPNRHLTVRVPASLQFCTSVGLDIVAWMVAGMVDVVVAQPLHIPNENFGPSIGDADMDPTFDYTPFVRAAAGTTCKFHAVLQSSVHADRLDEGTIEYIRGNACNIWAQGVDGLYLSSWCAPHSFAATAAPAGMHIVDKSSIARQL
eukprot:SAG31_NODE_1442_length_8325_cov_5.564916_6_plen_198_part_00